MPSFENLKDKNDTVSSVINGKINTWDQDLQLLTIFPRSSENQSAGFTANMLMFGRENNMPVDIISGVAKPNLDEKTPTEWLKQLNDRLNYVQNVARENLRKTQKQQKRLYDQRSYENIFVKGD